MNFKSKLRDTIHEVTPTAMVLEQIELSILKEELEVFQAETMLEYGLDQLDSAVAFSELAGNDMIDTVTGIVMAGGVMGKAKEGIKGYLKAVRDFFARMVKAVKEFYKKHLSQVGRYRKKIKGADDSLYNVSGDPKNEHIKVSLNHLPMGATAFNASVDAPMLKLFLKSVKTIQLDKLDVEMLGFNASVLLWLKGNSDIKTVTKQLDVVHEKIATIFLMGDTSSPKAIKDRDDVMHWLPGLPNTFIEMTAPGSESKGIKWGKYRSIFQPTAKQEVLAPAVIKSLRDMSKETIDVAYDFSKDTVGVTSALDKMNETLDKMLKDNATEALDNLKDTKKIVKHIRELTGLVNFLIKHVGAALTGVAVEAHNYATISAKQYESK